MKLLTFSLNWVFAVGMFVGCQPRELPSRYVEMSYVSRPPGYDTRRHPNGEPPGYLDTSQRDFPHERDFPHDTERGYSLDERGYPSNSQHRLSCMMSIKQ